MKLKRDLIESHVTAERKELAEKVLYAKFKEIVMAEARVERLRKEYDKLLGTPVEDIIHCTGPTVPLWSNTQGFVNTKV